MILSSLFSFGQKAHFQTIFPKAKFFEFNSNRDKIYIYSYGKLSVYDINKNKLSVIDTNIYAETVRNRFPFFLAKTGLVYFVNDKYVYEIKDDEIIKKAPFIYEEYSGGMIDAAYRKKEEQKMKEFNKLIADYEDGDIKKLMDDIFILNYKDGHSVAFEHRRLKVDNLTKENKAKILKHVKQVDLDTDTSFIIEDDDETTISHFNNKKLIIKEKKYSCRKASFMSLSSDCKYKMDIEFNNKTIKLKDTYRKYRGSLKDGGKLKGDLYRHLSNSKRITDKNGDIYLLFWEKDEHNLIKLPINQFGSEIK